jgi:hypothetical protein
LRSISRFAGRCLRQARHHIDGSDPSRTPFDSARGSAETGRHAGPGAELEWRATG